jgi:hypothetical protein
MMKDSCLVTQLLAKLIEFEIWLVVLPKIGNDLFVL